MDLDRRLTAFSFRRQRLDGSAAGALDAIGAVVGVYAVNPSGPLSIRARSPRVTADEVQALDRDRLAERMRAMRTSGFLVPRSIAPLVRVATAVPLERFAWLLRAARVEPERFEAVRAVVLAATDEPRTASEVRARLDRGGMDVRGLDIGPLLSLMSLRSEVVAVGAATLTSNVSRYQARAAWLAVDARAVEHETPEHAVAPAPVTDPDPVAARTWLAGAYLRAFGPARIADLAWWAGWSVRQATETMATLDTVDVGGGRLLRAADLLAWESTEPLPDAVTLVPKWDAWTMGYPLDGRARFIDRDVHDRVYDGDGNGLGMVLLGGRAIGAWASRSAGSVLAVELDVFDMVPARTRAAVETTLGEVASFLGYNGLTVRDVPSVIPRRTRIRRPPA